MTNPQRPTGNRPSTENRPSAGNRRDAAIDVLIRAWMRGKLRHGFCCSCAVGHLVQASGVPVGAAHHWYDAMSSYTLTARERDLAEQQLGLLPYTFAEIDLIERTFEAVGADVDPDAFRRPHRRL